MKKLPLLVAISVLATLVHAEPAKHFHPKGKPPSADTVAKQERLRKSLPLADKRDFDDAKRGFIAAPDYKKIMAEKGNVAWDMGSYDFLLQGQDYNSIHPSLQRQAVLNMAYGLYEVVPGKIYQLRGFDLANLTIIRGDSGWILFDVLTTAETAKAALAFANEKLGARPVTGVIVSHSHADHFGGLRGVVDEADVRSGKVPLIVPAGFMEHAVAENIYAGNAMTRRAFYQYGVLLPRSPFGHVDQAIGKNVASGNTGLIEPNRYVEKDIEEITIDGVRMVFQNTPGTEAPSEMNTWFPDLKAFWAAENITGTIHNIYTLRGALIRDPLMWSKHINTALYKFGKDAEVMFAAHSWPRFGNDRVQQVMRDQRDAYAHLNNQVLHLANNGVTINEVHNVYKLPQSLQQSWAAHSYHGSEEHNSRAVINRYLGYWDANPTTLIPLSPKDSAPLYVEMMGGADKIMKKAAALHKEGQYLQATEILNKLVYAQPANQAAKDALADSFEQIGYQKESTSLRNSFLAAAMELRSGIPAGVPPRTLGPDLIRGMSTQLALEFLAILVDSTKTEGMKFVVNLLTPDNGEKFVVEMSNGALTTIAGAQADKADLAMTVNRSDLESIVMGKSSIEQLIQSGKMTLQGDPKPLGQLKSVLTPFNPIFEILPGTAPK
jgi:alkyl sulfatase BDS1-like metallo-beta-lactamase superfamily hydrolase